MGGLIIKPPFIEMYRCLERIQSAGVQGTYIPAFMPYDFSSYPLPPSPTEWCNFHSVDPDVQSKFIGPGDHNLFLPIYKAKRVNIPERRLRGLINSGIVVKDEAYNEYCLGNLTTSFDIFRDTLIHIAAGPLALVNKWFAVTSLAESLGLPEPKNKYVQDIFQVKMGHIRHAKVVIANNWMDPRSINNNK